MNRTRKHENRFGAIKRIGAGILGCLLIYFGLQSLSQPTEPALDAATVAPAPRYVSKKIEEIEVGDYVLARDETTGELASKPVVNVFHRVSDHLQILDVRSSATGEFQRIETTDEHPFWVTDHGWVKAADLKPGDELTDSENGTAIVLANTYEAHEEGIPVFNFEVADLHTYHVRAGGTRGPPLWVHNNCNFISLDAFESAARSRTLARSGNAPTGRFGGVVANTAEEAAFLRNAAATFGDSSVFTAARRFDGSIIIQRSDIPFSVQNVRRMASGNTPFVRNSLGEWEKLNIHHVGRQDGKLIEIFSSHNTYNPTTGGPLHIPGPGSPIRDATFTRNYWMQRLQDATDAGHVPQDVLRQAGL